MICFKINQRNNLFAKNGIPLYLQLKDKILEDIKLNYKAQDMIPPESKLEQIYKVSRITIRKAIEELQRDNVVIKKQGRGTFVQDQKILYDANSIGSLTQRLSQQNHSLKTISIEFEIIKDPHPVKNLLQCNTLLCIKRTRFLDSVPFALMKNYIDYKKVPDIQEQFKIESLYTFLKERYNIEFFSAEETVEAKVANTMQAQMLGISENSPLLSLKRLSFDANRNPLEYSDLLIKANMYTHKIMLQK